MASIFSSKLSIFDFRRLYSSMVSWNNNGPVGQKKAVADTEQDASVTNAERNGVGSHLTAEDSSKCKKRGVPDRAEMRRVFDRFDENKDGVVCSLELTSFLKKLGFEMTDEEVSAMVKTVDENCNGAVDFEEFYKLYTSMNDSDETAESADQNEDDDENLWEAFKVFDKDKDGYITVHELQSVLVSLGILEGNSLKKCYKMIESVDSDGNGQVDFKEFKKMMSSNALQTVEA